METQVRIINPAEAARLLTLNCCNRPLMEANVAFFENHLRLGELQLTHQGIAIGSSGKLLDGQHRLTAIVRTGISAELLVATDVADAAFAVLDTGAGRTARDVLGIHGAIYASTTAAAIRLYLCHASIKGIWAGTATRLCGTTSRIKAEYDKDSEGWAWAARAAQIKASPKLVTPGPAGFVLYLAAKHHCYNRQYLEKFLEDIKEGAGLPPGHPILAYRNKVLLMSATYKAQARAADYIKLLNAYASGQKLKIFKAQPYPPMPTLMDASESLDEGAAA